VPRACDALPYNPANFMRTLASPEAIAHWSLTSLGEKLVKIGANVVSHGRYVIFQMAEIAVPRELFGEMLRLIDGLRPRPAPAQEPGWSGVSSRPEDCVRMRRAKWPSRPLQNGAGRAQRRKRPGRRLSASAYPSRMLSFAPIPSHLGNVG